MNTNVKMVRSNFFAVGDTVTYKGQEYVVAVADGNGYYNVTENIAGVLVGIKPVSGDNRLAFVPEHDCQGVAK